MRPVSIDFAEKPLADVVRSLGEMYRIPFELDAPSLAAAGIGFDAPITRSLGGVTLKSALELILADLDLICVVEGDKVIVRAKAPRLRAADRKMPARETIDLHGAGPHGGRGARIFEHRQHVVDQLVVGRRNTPREGCHASGPAEHTDHKVDHVATQLEHDSVPSRLANQSGQIEFAFVTGWPFTFRCVPPRLAATRLHSVTPRPEATFGLPRRPNARIPSAKDLPLAAAAVIPFSLTAFMRPFC